GMRMPGSRDAQAHALALAQQLLSARADRPRLLPLAAKLVRELELCRHSVDFASVLWHGQLYGFSASQAATVRVLWAAWRNGTPDVRQETLLSAIGSESDRLADLFRNHAAWGTLIVSGPAKGTYRLQEPPAEGA